jgi:competence protein ComEC
MLRTPLRWSGAAPAVAASLRAVTTPLPDVLVSGDGQAAAIRGGDSRTVKDKSLRDGVTCDAADCIGRLSDGRLVSQALLVEAFAKDCVRAAVVVSAQAAPGACAARLIDRKAWRANGVVALRWTGSFRVQRRAAARLPAALGAELTQRK